MAKKDTESAFSALNEIAQDFYADRTTDVFHGITEDYVEVKEKVLLFYTNTYTTQGRSHSTTSEFIQYPHL